MQERRERDQATRDSPSNTRKARSAASRALASRSPLQNGRRRCRAERCRAERRSANDRRSTRPERRSNARGPPGHGLARRGKKQQHEKSDPAPASPRCERETAMPGHQTSIPLRPGEQTKKSAARPTRPAGFEPATGGVEVRCSVQLSYERREPRGYPSEPAGNGLRLSASLAWLGGCLPGCLPRCPRARAAARLQPSGPVADVACTA